METVLITGANSGFGYLTALTFARNGYKVYATARSLDKEGVQELNDIVKAENLNLEWLVLDITNQSQIDEAFKKVKSLDILVNNAGYGMVGFVETFSAEDFLKQLDTNLVGDHRMIKAVLPIMKEQGHGKIINVASIAGKASYPRYGIYSASKFGVEGYSEALRAEVFKFGIGVAMIEPGTFNTNFGKRIVKGKEKAEGYEIKDTKEDVPPMLSMILGMFRMTSNPQRVADRIFKVAQMKRMPLHNYVGRDAVIINFFKRCVPERFWDWLVLMIFKSW